MIGKSGLPHLRKKLLLTVFGLAVGLGTGCTTVGGHFDFTDESAARRPFPLGAPQVTGALWDWRGEDAHSFRVVDFTECGIEPDGAVRVRLWTETRYRQRREDRAQLVSEHPWLEWRSSVTGLRRLKRVASRTLEMERAEPTDLAAARALASELIRESGSPVTEDEASLGASQGGLALFTVHVGTGAPDESPHQVDCLAIWDPREGRWVDATALPARRQETPDLAVTALTAAATPFTLALDVASGPPLILVGSLWYAASSAYDSLVDD